jgi:glutathione S-transferase
MSPYCEKTRWTLDIKGLDYTTRNLFPGRHHKIDRGQAAESSVPLLMDRSMTIQDSSAIAMYLEHTYAGPRLLPDDDGLRSLVLALENYFDISVGPAVRHWCYGQLLRRRGMATRFFFAAYDRRTRWLARLARPLFERRLAAAFSPDAASMESAERTTLDGIERLENVTEHDPERYLVGESLTLADITAAALLAPMIGPANSPWGDSDRLTPGILEMRARLRARPGGQWVLRRYERDRETRSVAAAAVE